MEIETKSENIRLQQEVKLERQIKKHLQKEVKQKKKALRESKSTSKRYSVPLLLTYICREREYQAEMSTSFMRHMKWNPEFCRDPANVDLCLSQTRIYQLSHDSNADHGALDRFANAGALQIHFTSSLLKGYFSIPLPEQPKSTESPLPASPTPPTVCLIHPDSRNLYVNLTQLATTSPSSKLPMFSLVFPSNPSFPVTLCLILYPFANHLVLLHLLR
jgi:hypothetical protein